MGQSQSHFDCASLPSNAMFPRAVTVNQGDVVPHGGIWQRLEIFLVATT